MNLLFIAIILFIFLYYNHFIFIYVVRKEVSYKTSFRGVERGGIWRRITPDLTTPPKILTAPPFFELRIF